MNVLKSASPQELLPEPFDFTTEEGISNALLSINAILGEGPRQPPLVSDIEARRALGHSISTWNVGFDVWEIHSTKPLAVPAFSPVPRRMAWLTVAIATLGRLFNLMFL